MFPNQGLWLHPIRIILCKRWLTPNNHFVEGMFPNLGVTNQELFLPPVMFSTLQEYHQAIASAIGMDSIHYPTKLGEAWSHPSWWCYMCLQYHACHPPTKPHEKAATSTSILGGETPGCLKSGIMCQSDTHFTAQITRNMGRRVTMPFDEMA